VGLIKGTKIGSIRDDAARAIEEDRQVFVARYWDEMIAFQGTGSVSGAAEAIEAVQDAGWKLQHMAYSWVDSKKRGLTMMVFGR
jgi:hypothetical protein